MYIRVDEKLVECFVFQLEDVPRALSAGSCYFLRSSDVGGFCDDEAEDSCCSQSGRRHLASYFLVPADHGAKRKAAFLYLGFCHF
jgi:hypothetical protein